DLVGDARQALDTLDAVDHALELRRHDRLGLGSGAAAGARTTAALGVAARQVAADRLGAARIARNLGVAFTFLGRTRPAASPRRHRRAVALERARHRDRLAAQRGAAAAGAARDRGGGEVVGDSGALLGGDLVD